jgi:hypothetical protein
MKKNDGGNVGIEVLTTTIKGKENGERICVS